MAGIERNNYGVIRRIDGVLRDISGTLGPFIPMFNARFYSRVYEIRQLDFLEIDLNRGVRHPESVYQWVLNTSTFSGNIAELQADGHTIRVSPTLTTTRGDYTVVVSITDPVLSAITSAFTITFRIIYPIATLNDVYYTDITLAQGSAYTLALDQGINNLEGRDADWTIDPSGTFPMYEIISGNILQISNAESSIDIGFYTIIADCSIAGENIGQIEITVHVIISVNADAPNLNSDFYNTLQVLYHADNTAYNLDLDSGITDLPANATTKWAIANRENQENPPSGIALGTGNVLRISASDIDLNPIGTYTIRVFVVVTDSNGDIIPLSGTNIAVITFSIREHANAPVFNASYYPTTLTFHKDESTRYDLDLDGGIANPADYMVRWQLLPAQSGETRIGEYRSVDDYFIIRSINTIASGVYVNRFQVDILNSQNEAVAFSDGDISKTIVITSNVIDDGIVPEPPQLDSAYYSDIILNKQSDMLWALDLDGGIENLPENAITVWNFDLQSSDVLPIGIAIGAGNIIQLTASQIASLAIGEYSVTVDVDITGDNGETIALSGPDSVQLTFLITDQMSAMRSGLTDDRGYFLTDDAGNTLGGE